jgi:hypothetical protein
MLAREITSKGLKRMAKTVNSGFCIPIEQHKLLRAAARGRQARLGGRCSASALISELIEKYRAALQKEALTVPSADKSC